MSRLPLYLLLIVSAIGLTFACISISRQVDSLALIQEEQVRELAAQIRRVELQIERQGSLLDNSSILKQVKELTTSNKRLEDSLGQQAALLGRTVGTVLPVNIPPALMEELSTLESYIKDPMLWPSSKEASTEYANRVSKAVAQVPSWVEADHLSQLNTIRWAALVFQLLQLSESSSLEDLQSHANSLREAASIAPEEIPSEFQQEILTKAAKLEDSTKQKLILETVTAAEEAIKNKSDYSGLIAVDERLRMLGNDDEVLEMLGRVHSEIGRRETDQKIEELAQRFEAIQARLINRPSLYEQAISILATEVALTRVSHLLNNDSLPPSLEALDVKLESTIRDYQRAIAKKDEKKYADAFRSYQIWTLSQIKAFDEAMETALANAKANSRVYGETWTYAEYDLVKKAIINHLLPVNPAFLDLPVNERYQKAFQHGWTKLDVEDRDYQTYVAEQSAKIEKKSLSSFENQ